MKKTIINLVRTSLMSAFIVAAPFAAQAQDAAGEAGVRAMVVTAEAVVTNIDLKTRQISLMGSDGHTVTLTAREQVVKLEDVNIGDVLSATYLTALEGELRKPTEEELAEPWVVIEDSEAGTAEGHPVAGTARMIRAVCTIEGMNRVLGTVTLLDPNGKLHLIGDVEPEKMEGVTLGQTIVIVFTEALAVSLEHVAAQGDTK